MRDAFDIAVGSDMAANLTCHSESCRKQRREYKKLAEVAGKDGEPTRLLDCPLRMGKRDTCPRRSGSVRCCISLVCLGTGRLSVSVSKGIGCDRKARGIAFDVMKGKRELAGIRLKPLP